MTDDGRADLEPKERASLWGKRDFLHRGGWLALVATLLLSGGGFFRLLFRRAPVRPPTVFRAGKASDYRPGTVSDRYIKAWRVFIVRQEETIFAVYAKCTHLGCTPRWYQSADKFKCPCHGSGFTPAGVNFEGPAPRPLARAKIWQDKSGELLVDVASRYWQPDWENPESFVTVEKEEVPT